MLRVEADRAAHNVAAAPLLALLDLLEQLQLLLRDSDAYDGAVRHSKDSLARCPTVLNTAIFARLQCLGEVPI